MDKPASPGWFATQVQWNDNSWSVHEVNRGTTVVYAEWLDEKSARLIAAAPDMFEALGRMIRVVEFLAVKHPQQRDVINRAKAALAKAEGK